MTHGSDQRLRTVEENRRVRIRSLAASAVLAVGAIGGWLGLVHARGHGDYTPLLWWGLLVLVLAVGSMLCLAVPLVRRIEARAVRPAVTSAARSQPNGEYVARYSPQDQVIAIILTILFGCITVFMLVRSHRTFFQVAFVALLCGLIAYAMQVTTTNIRFTNDRIIARLPWFRTISKPYTAIERLQSKPGTIRIQFTDGRSLNLHSGLGDPDLVVGYLQAHCPESIVPEHWPRGRR
jgi:MFS family permease